MQRFFASAVWSCKILSNYFTINLINSNLYKIVMIELLEN